MKRVTNSFIFNEPRRMFIVQFKPGKFRVLVQMKGCRGLFHKFDWATCRQPADWKVAKRLAECARDIVFPPMSKELKAKVIGRLRLGMTMAEYEEHLRANNK